jgi:hypothetical protein
MATPNSITKSEAQAQAEALALAANAPVQTGLADVALGSSNFSDEIGRDDELIRLNTLLQSALSPEEGEAGTPSADPDEIARILNEIRRAGKGGEFKNIDELITGRSGQAIDLLRQGSAEQLRLARLGTEAGVAPLEAQIDLRALEEQQSILGQRGLAEQEAAISNIPVSAFNRELQRRQRQQLTRGAAASGELGGGATIAAGSQLAGAQQSDVIQRRLAELEPLAKASRGLSSTVSQLREQGRVGEAQLQSGLGTQVSNIRLGVVAPQIQSRISEAELSGLRGIASAQRSGQTAQQLAGLAGVFAGQTSGG